MRVLYKALASVGMVALSTAAAFGVRHLAKRAKAKKEAQKQNQAENKQDKIEEIQSCEEKADHCCEKSDDSSEKSDDCNDNVVTADVEIPKDTDDSAKEAE
jgi:hypothetical protein